MYHAKGLHHYYFNCHLFELWKLLPSSIHVFTAVFIPHIVGAICVNEGDIHLVNGTSEYNGQVEVCHDNVWGTVCSDDWDINDGIVACHQLGLEYVSVSTSEYLGGQIWLDDLMCIGTEIQLVDCTHNKFGVHDCRRTDSAYLFCQGTVE